MKNNIKALRQTRGITQAELALRTGVGIPQVSKWENGRVDIPASRLTEIANVLGTTADMLLRSDYVPRYLSTVQHSRTMPGSTEGEPVETNAHPFRMEGASDRRMRDDLPVYGSALGAAREIDGEAIEQTTLNRAEIVQYAKRPVLLESNATAYGLYVSGSSMEPRHLDGDMILIDPKGRVRGGDDVVVYLRPLHPEDDDGERARAVLVKRLIRRTSGYIELEQFQPARTFKLDAAEIVRIDRVIPWQELIT